MPDKCVSPPCGRLLVFDRQMTGRGVFRCHCGLRLLRYQSVDGQWSIEGPVLVDFGGGSQGKLVLRIDFDKSSARLRLRESGADLPDGITQVVKWAAVNSIEPVFLDGPTRIFDTRRGKLHLRAVETHFGSC